MKLFYLKYDLDRPVSLWMNIFMLKINAENFPKYIYYYLSSHIWKKLILENAQWAVTKTITKISVKNIKIPLPPLEKQKEIVSYLDEVFEKNKVIKAWYEKKLEELEEMKQSILKEAFEGRLVTGE
jgi:type I restriction enzyme S subunit